MIDPCFTCFFCLVCSPVVLLWLADDGSKWFCSCCVSFFQITTCKSVWYERDNIEVTLCRHARIGAKCSMRPWLALFHGFLQAAAVLLGRFCFSCFSFVFLENWFFAHWYWFDDRSNFWHPQYPSNLLDLRRKGNNAALRYENREFKICTITILFRIYFLPPIRCGDVLICNHIWPWNSSWQCDFTLDTRSAQSKLLQLVTCFFVMHIAFWNLSHLEEKSMHQPVLHGSPKISVKKMLTYKNTVEPSFSFLVTCAAFCWRKLLRRLCCWFHIGQAEYYIEEFTSILYST